MQTSALPHGIETFSKKVKKSVWDFLLKNHFLRPLEPIYIKIGNENIYAIYVQV